MHVDYRKRISLLSAAPLQRIELPISYLIGTHKNGRDLIGKAVLGAKHPRAPSADKIAGSGGKRGAGGARGRPGNIHSYVMRNGDLWWLLGGKPRGRNASVSNRDRRLDLLYYYIRARWYKVFPLLLLLLLFFSFFSFFAPFIHILQYYCRPRFIKRIATAGIVIECANVRRTDIGGFRFGKKK